MAHSGRDLVPPSHGDWAVRPGALSHYDHQLQLLVEPQFRGRRRNPGRPGSVVTVATPVTGPGVTWISRAVPA